jgi:hypothetical protein
MSRDLDQFLGERGRAARMPEGIRVWGEKAARAGALDATMGVITAPRALLESGADGVYGIAYLREVREAFAAWDQLEVFPYAPVAGVRAFREGWRRWIGGKAAGYIAAQTLTPYPPGIPILIPGERITKEICDYLQNLSEKALRVSGQETDTLRTVKVVAVQ